MPEPIIRNTWMSIGVRLVAALVAVVFVLQFTKMTIRVRAPTPTSPAAASPAAAPHIQS